MFARRLSEPLWLSCSALYVANRAAGWLELRPRHWFLDSYLGDLLFFPVAFPLLLVIHEITGVRTVDDEARPLEILFWLVLWSLLFEVVFPAFPGRGVADPYDVLCYALGTTAFMILRKPPTSRAAAVS